MSNLIPPLLSSSPPPIVGPLDEDDDDEFGDFRAAADSYDCDDFSLPPSPHKSPDKELKADFSKVNLDINSNKSQKVTSTTEMPTHNLSGSVLCEEVDKDFQDRRKSEGDVTHNENEVNCSDSQSTRSLNDLDIQNNVVDLNADVKSDQVEKHELREPNSEHSDEHKNEPEVDNDFSDLQCAVPSSINDCDLNQDELINGDNFGDFNSFSNEDNIFEALSESIQEKTNNSDDSSELNETNEIKSEDDGIHEINFEITDKDNEKDDNSSKEINYDDLSEASVSLKNCETDTKVSDDDFGDFENHFPNEVVECLQNTAEDEFDDFVEPLPPPTQVVDQPVDDDFGDFESSEFDTFTSQSCEKPVFLDINMKNAAEKSETILKDIFPSLDTQIDEFDNVNETERDRIFAELKDITETNALIYQWSKSNSQKMFLRSLNIDTRNILYGPAWSCSMPRFAANLGLTPLEPVKSEILTPTPVQNVSSPSNSSQKNNSDIPTAQFDWSGSGLINPLDSTSAELPGNVPEESSQPQGQTDFLPTASDKQETVPSLFETENVKKPPVAQAPTQETENNIELPKVSNGQSDDFTPFHSPKLIPLRETHISTELNDLFNKPGWLQPTILTPDLPRKETVIDAEDDDDDEFDDFQMVLPEENKEKESDNKSSPVTLPDLSEFDMTSKVPSVDKPLHNQEHIFGIVTNSGPISSPVQQQSNANDDDEFTEFHSSAPPVEILKPLQPVPLEPLKPTVQYSAPVTQINWPDPGVTDEDIKNIELTYSRKVESPKPEKAVEKTKTVKQEMSKENSVDDDEWTDFVSVTNPVKSVMPERTSTPDLPLSVLNLNNVQAPKKPIPVITSSGLVQTKLSSNITLQPKSVVQTTVQHNLFRPPTTQFHPSIISNQFAANFFSTSNNTSAPSAKSQDDDDDWTDFVSSQPPPQVNGYQQKTALNHVKNPQMNRTNATTNIIMNPTHFETLQSYGPPQNKKVTAMPARNAIPSISAIPDLDFIAPKNRTSKK